MRLREFTQTATSLRTAEVLSGRYRLDEILGSGGAAHVHRGYDLRLRRPVAVKVFRPEADIDTGVEQDLHNEAVMLARLHHPGLVTAYDTGQHDGRAFLVMRLIEGDNLRKHIAEGPLLPRATAAVGAGVAQALAHAHEAGVVHRDIKPSNIVLDAAHRPHLVDFGISRLLDATSRTTAGTLIGTAAYLAPEQVLGRPVGRAADVYALGLVLLECLTGTLEYDGIPLEAAIARLHRAPVLPPGLPEQLSTLIRDMTSLDERERPAARDCARTLAALAEEAPTAAGAAANTTRLVAGRGATRPAEETHRSPAPRGERAAPRTGFARGRLLLAGASVALAAVTVTAFAVTDGSVPWGDGAGTSAAVTPSAKPSEPGPPAGAAQKAATPSEARPPGAQASAGARPGPAGTTRSAVPEEDAAPDSAGPATGVTRGGPEARPQSQPPGQAKKAKKEKKAGPAEKSTERRSRGRAACAPPACGSHP
ncbi:protein kinase [Streptomyces sp. NPDC005426]|uniref:serine/threonine-protein kinase n=1 Tax=unclassified Streptomyces TaxID=2593676 RepID=UPI0033AD690F